MTRRLEAGPLLVTLGALLLLVSLFLNWFTGEITAWQGFEVWDLVLFVLALGSIAAGLGLTTQEVEVIDRRFLPAGVAAVAVIVASQLLDPPPAAAGQDPDTGAWLALGAALVMCAGAVLTFGRVHLSLTVEGRERAARRRRGRARPAGSDDGQHPGRAARSRAEPEPARRAAGGCSRATGRPSRSPSPSPSRRRAHRGRTRRR